MKEGEDKMKGEGDVDGYRLRKKVEDALGIT